MAQVHAVGAGFVNWGDVDIDDRAPVEAKVDPLAPEMDAVVSEVDEFVSRYRALGEGAERGGGEGDGEDFANEGHFHLLLFRRGLVPAMG
jgi:hypothetical protein